MADRARLPVLGDAPSTGRGSDELLARLAAIDVCSLSDALDALGLTGVLQGVRPMWEGARLVGRAVTVQLAAGPPPAADPVHLGARALATSGPGQVIVVANSGRTEMGAWGGLLSAAARHRGVAGVVIDGACRDVDEARAMHFPVFARQPVARTARGRLHEVSTGEPILVDGLEIRTGDVVVADTSGIVVLPAASADVVTARAEAIVEREARMREDLLAGLAPEVVLGTAYQNMLE